MTKSKLVGVGIAVAQVSLQGGTLMAQSGLDGALSKGGTIIFKIAYLIGCILIMHGGWSIREGNPDRGKMSILGGLLLAAAMPIMDAFYGATGMESATVKFR